MKNNFLWKWNPLQYAYRKCKISCNNEHHLSFKEGFKSLNMLMFKGFKLNITNTGRCDETSAGLKLYIVPLPVSAA